MLVTSIYLKKHNGVCFHLLVNVCTAGIFSCLFSTIFSVLFVLCTCLQNNICFHCVQKSWATPSKSRLLQSTVLHLKVCSAVSVCRFDGVIVNHLLSHCHSLTFFCLLSFSLPFLLWYSLTNSFSFLPFLMLSIIFLPLYLFISFTLSLSLSHFLLSFLLSHAHFVSLPSPWVLNCFGGSFFGGVFVSSVSTGLLSPPGFGAACVWAGHWKGAPCSAALVEGVERRAAL